MVMTSWILHVHTLRIWHNKNIRHIPMSGLMKIGEIYAKSQYILHRKWSAICILCTHQQKSHKLDEGIVLIFVFGKDRPLLLAKGVKSRIFSELNIECDKIKTFYGSVNLVPNWRRHCKNVFTWLVSSCRLWVIFWAKSLNESQWQPQ